MRLNPLRFFKFGLLSALVFVSNHPAFSDFKIPVDSRVCRVRVEEGKTLPHYNDAMEVHYTCSGQGKTAMEVEHLNAKLDAAITLTVDKFLEKGFQIQWVGPSNQTYLLVRNLEKLRASPLVD